MTTFDYAKIIKDRITMPELLPFYGFPTSPHGRIPCPLHGGKNDNFSYNDHCYFCFTCGARGDVITFVQDYFNLSFAEACAKLNENFILNLPIGKRITLRQKSNYTDELRRIREINEKRRLLARAAEIMYDEALDKVVLCEKVIMGHKPRRGDTRLDWSYAWAIDNIERYRHELDLAAEMRDKYDN